MADVPILPMPSRGSTVSLQVLAVDHYQVLDTALSHLLSTKIARQSLTQLMDGLPTWTIYREAAGLINHQNAPIRQHLENCEGSEDLADAFIRNFNTSALEFDASLLQAFQDAPPGSDEFRIRLLELLARSVHCIGVSVEKYPKKAHKGDIAAVTSFQKPGGTEYGFPIITFPPRPSMFYHPDYCHSEQYPFGAADVAGYWLEDRIFGGVILFDRGESGQELNSVWLHSGRSEWTFRVWKLLDWQLDAIMSFCVNGPDLKDPLFDFLPVKADSPASRHPEPSSLRRSKFPFFCDIDNPHRHDDWDAMAYHHIYRDPWERKIPEEKPERCVLNLFDYPEQIAMVTQVMDMVENDDSTYNAIAPILPPHLDKPYEELTPEERVERSAAMLDFKIEKVKKPQLSSQGSDYGRPEETVGNGQDKNQTKSHTEQNNDAEEGHVHGGIED